MSCIPIPCTDIPAKVDSPGVSLARRWTLIATILGSSMEFIDGTVVNVSLPSMQSAFHATGIQVQWIVESYSLFLSALLLVGGALGDRLGLRRTFLLGILLFGTASVGCGSAETLGWLLFARCLQGIGGALLVPNSLALLSASFSQQDRGRAIGTWSAYAAMMTAVGPVLGGWMVQHGSWRWVFFLNIPIAIATIVIVRFKTETLPAVQMQPPLDWVGALLGVGGLSGLTFALMQWTSGGTVTHVAAGISVLLIGALALWERRVPTPMIPIQLFASRTFVGANLLTFFLYAALAIVLYYLPLNLIEVQGYTPSMAGAAMVPLVIMMFLLSRFAGELVPKVGARKLLIIGPLIASAGFALLARPGLGGSYWTTYFPAMIVLGIGMAISVSPLTTVVMSSTDSKHSGVASGFNNTVSQTAALLALALTATLFPNVFSAALTKKLQLSHLSRAEIEGIRSQTARLANISTAHPEGRLVINSAFVSGFRLVVLLAAGAALTAAVAAAVTIAAPTANAQLTMRGKE